MRKQPWLIGLILLGVLLALWTLFRVDTPAPETPPGSAVASISPPASPSASPDTPASPSASPSESAVPTVSATPLPPPPPVDAKSALNGLGTRELTARDRIDMKLPEKLWGGVVITEVSPTSPGAEAHIEPGDVIFRAGGAKITSWDELVRAIGDRGQTRIQGYRGGQPYEVVLQRPWDPAEK